MNTCVVVSRFLVSQLLQGGTMSRKCYSSAFKLRAAAITEAQSYLFPCIVSGCISYKCQSQISAGLN